MRGIDRFRQDHPSTAWLYDIKHKTACLLKHALEGDASWQVFVEKVHRFKQQVSFTPLAALAPPQQRSKARYMNVDVLVDWAEESLRLLDRPQAMRKAGLNVRRVEEKLGWLRKFVPQVRRWGEMLAVIGAAEHYVRHEGIHAQAAEELAAVLPKPATPAACRLRKQLLEFVEMQGRQAREGERLLGSSEVLESIIGKFKTRGGRAGPARTDGHGVEHRRVGRQRDGGHGAGRHDGDYDPRRLELVSIASWCNGTKRPSTDQTRPPPGTKTENTTP